MSDHEGKNAVIINFVPAAFSPGCSRQLTLIEQKRAVVGKDVKVAWIEPAPKISEMPDYNPVLSCISS